MHSIDNMSFKEKVVIVTGASSGIGAATAEIFAHLGASVVLVARNLEKLKLIEENCKIANVNAKICIIKADLTTDAEKIINETISKCGKLDVLVNNAGIFRMTNFMQSDVNELDTLMNTNLRAVHILTKLAIPYILKTKGNIINVSSIGGITASEYAFNYRITKAALDQFTKCLALELARHKVRVNSVNPATIKTDIFAAQGMNAEKVMKFLENAAPKHPIGRVGTAEEVGRTIAFLASDEATFITGSLIPIDGGRSKVAI